MDLSLLLNMTHLNRYNQMKFEVNEIVWVMIKGYSWMARIGDLVLIQITKVLEQ